MEHLFYLVHGVLMALTTWLLQMVYTIKGQFTRQMASFDQWRMDHIKNQDERMNQLDRRIDRVEDHRGDGKRGDES